MKKLILSILAVIYFGLSSGFSVHLHYCMDKLEGWDLEYSHEPVENKCSNCNMPQNGEDDCCSVEQKLVKLDEEQSINIQSFNLLKSISALGNLPSQTIFIVQQDQTYLLNPARYCFSQAPKLALFKQYRNYRI